VIKATAWQAQNWGKRFLLMIPGRYAGFTAAGADFLEHGAVTARRCADGDGFPMCRECVAACIATAHHGDGSCRRMPQTGRSASIAGRQALSAIPSN